MKTQFLVLVLLALSCALSAQLPPKYKVGHSLYSYQSRMVSASGSNYQVSDRSGIMNFNRAGFQGIQLPYGELAREIFQKELPDNSLFHLGYKIENSVLSYNWIKEINNAPQAEGAIPLSTFSIVTDNLIFEEGEDEKIYFVDKEQVIRFDMTNGDKQTIVDWELEEISSALFFDNKLYSVTRKGQIIEIDVTSGEVNIAFDDVAYNFHAIEQLGSGLVVYGGKDEETAIAIELNNQLEISQTHTFELGYVTDVFLMPSGDWIVAKSEFYNPLFTADCQMMRVNSSDDETLWIKEMGEGYGQYIHKFADNMYVIDITKESHEIVYFWENGTFRDDIHLHNKEFEYFDKNNIRTPFSTVGSLFNVTGSEGLFVPQDALGPSIFMGGLWLKGKNSSGGLHAAGVDYGAFAGDSDYTAGVIGDDSKAYHQIWKLEDYQLFGFLQDWEDGVLDSDIPYPILTWPAKGNPHLRSMNYEYAELDRDLAPFIDVNGDGTYDPYQGDYPKMKGHQMLLWIMNDLIVHGTTSENQLSTEVITMVYGYKSTTDENKNNSIFLEFDVINRSDKTYEDFKIGYWQDVEVGCWSDDATAIMPEEDLVIYYNWDEIDGDNTNLGECLGSFPTFDELPIQTCQFLNQDIDYYMTTTTIGTTINGQSGFFNSLHFMDGQWPNGVPLTQGGWGYNDGTVNVNHQFSGNPSDPNSWSMCNLDPYDRDLRSIATTDIGDFAPDDRVSLQMAFTTLFNRGSCPDIEAIASELSSLEELVAVEEPMTKTLAQITISPNPATEVINIHWKTSEFKHYQIQLLNLNGQVLKTITNQKRLAINEFPSGIYIIQVKSKGKLIGVEKFVKTSTQ